MHLNKAKRISFPEIISILSFVLFLQPVHAQVDSGNYVKYTPEYQFKEGVYVTFERLKSNDPIPKGRIITNMNYDDNNFFDNVLSNEKLVYFDNIGNKLEIPSKNIWGYSRNGFLYIHVQNGYYRITQIGSICHFIAYVTTEYYNSPYYNSYYNSYSYSPRYNTSTTEMRQYILDFQTGRVLEYTVEGLDVLLMQDPELHDEYAALSKKKKKNQKFMYLRKFNERNPLYLIKQK